MHHYNFPPYSTGETGRVGSPKRREIGHGALAERALMPVLPSIEEFPYAIRQVSEALSSNGSTSMGSVCASTLSLLNAGVPLKAPVAGIAMGLVSDDVEVDGETERRFVTLTDILGAEDAFGDMDFKCAGTKDFVTALQLDTKLDGIPSQVLAGALAQAKDARITILEVMAEAIDEPDEMSPYAPRITTIKVPIDKIGEVIGPKGKMINSITEQTGASISIEDDGTVFVGATNGESAQAAIDMINAIANPQLPKIGERFLGTVVKTTDFGAFVSLLPGRDGLVHISQAGPRQADHQGRGRGARSATSSAWRSPTSTTAARSRWCWSPKTRQPRPPPTRRRDRLDGLRVLHPQMPRPAEHAPTSGPAHARCPAGCGSSRSSSRRCTRRRWGCGWASGHATKVTAWPAPPTSSNTCCSSRRRRARRSQIAQAVDAVGGELNAFTAREHTCYYAHVLDTDLELAVDLVADVVLRGQVRQPTTSRSSATSCSRRSPCATTIPRTPSATSSCRRCSATIRSAVR